MYKSLVIYLLHFLIYGLFSFSRRLLGQYLRCFKNESDKKGKQITELPSKVQHISLKHLASQNSARFICKKKWGLEAKCQQVLFCVFPGHLNNWCRALFKNVTFSRQKNYRRYFIIASLFENCLIFPPKDLEKIQALKIRMRRFFYFLISNIIKKSFNTLVYYYMIKT